MSQPDMFEGYYDLLNTADFGDFEDMFGTKTMEPDPSVNNVRDLNKDDDDDDNSQRKRYRRHTQHQTQKLEASFNECPNPDRKQRRKLSQELGLELSQVKFWFQNKRTQAKVRGERREIALLKAENEKLRVENTRYREAFDTATCPNCGGFTTLGEMQYLRIENARLRGELDQFPAESSFVREIDPVGAVLTPYEERRMYHPELSHLGDEFGIVVSRFNDPKL